jgi:hypothetical protein
MKLGKSGSESERNGVGVEDTKHKTPITRPSIIHFGLECQASVLLNMRFIILPEVTLFLNQSQVVGV